MTRKSTLRPSRYEVNGQRWTMGCGGSTQAVHGQDQKVINSDFVTAISSKSNPDHNTDTADNIPINTNPDSDKQSADSFPVNASPEPSTQSADNFPVNASPQPSTQSADNFPVNATDHMKRANYQPKILNTKGSEDGTTDSAKQTAGGSTMEQKICSLKSVSEEGAKEASALALQHPDLKNDFTHLTDIMDLFNQNKHEQFADKVSHLTGEYETGTKKFTHLMDFFAYIGGGEAVITVYTNTLKEFGWTHITEELLVKRNGEAKEVHAARQTVHELRSFVVDATDASLELAAHLAEAGLFPYLVEDVKNLTDSDYENGAEVFDTSVTILYNCARNQQLRQYYREISAVSLLTPILARKETGVKLLTLLTLSHIIDEEDNHLLLADDHDFDFLLEMVEFAWEDEDHRDMNGYSLQELLQGLGNLARNDDNKKLLMKKGAVECLKPILKDGRDEEKQEAVKVMWELAFNKDNQHLIQEDSSLMDILHTLNKHQNQNIARNANGALWVLNMDRKIERACLPATAQSRQGFVDSDIEPPPPPPPPAVFGGLAPPAPPPPGAPSCASAAPPPPPLAPSKPLAPAARGHIPLAPAARGHIMISYQWDNQEMLLQIRNKMREHNFQVWMDVDNISGSTLQAMAEAVEGASAVLMCMSQRYKDSPNCRTEAEYAFALHRPIIPLLMERSYKPNGWLGILLGSKLFFDFSGKYPFEKKMDELIRELSQQELSQRGLAGDDVDAEVAVVKHPLLAAARTHDASSWSQKDVTQWLNSHKLDGHASLKNLSGGNIKFLQKLSQRAPEFFFTFLKQDLGLKSLDDLMNVSNAIDKLP